MAADLSNSELRQRLMELGTSVGPITDSTRKLYLRKYTQLTSSTNRGSRLSKSPKDSKSHLGFSSDEGESFSENAPNRSSARTRKSTARSSILNNTPNISPELSPDESNFKKPRPTRSRRSLRKSVPSESPTFVNSNANGDVSHANNSARNPDVLANTSGYDMQVSDSDAEPGEASQQSYNTRSTNRSSNRNNIWPRDGKDERSSPSAISKRHDSLPRTSTPTKKFLGAYNDIEKPPNLVYPSLNYIASLKGNVV